MNGIDVLECMIGGACCVCARERELERERERMREGERASE